MGTLGICGGSVLVVIGVRLSRGVSHRLQQQLLPHPPSQLGVEVSKLGVALEGEADRVAVMPVSMHYLPEQMLLLQMLWS